MAEASLCPHLLVCGEHSTPEELEHEQMSVVDRHLSSLRKLEIIHRLGKPVLKYIRDSYPWAQMQDPRWKGWLLDWWNIIFDPLLKESYWEDHPIDDSDNYGDATCVAVTRHDLDSLWQRWLEWWQREIDDPDKGIGAAYWCPSPSPGSDKRLNAQTLIVKDPSEWSLVCYSWLLFYDQRLPYSGEFPFFPHQDWRTLKAPPRGPRYGFLDQEGNEWCWCKLHHDHWDVQLRVGGYRRVAPDGRILSMHGH